MQKWEKINKNSKSKKNKLFKNKNFKPIQFKKIENSFKLDFSNNKTSIILFKKSHNKNISTDKNKKQYNNIKIYNNSKSNDKKSKTLNNTFHLKMKLFNNSKPKNKINFSKNEKRNKILLSEIKNKDKNKKHFELKSLNKRTYSPINKSHNKNDKITFFTQKRNKTPIKDNNIRLFNNKLNVSPSDKNKNINYNFKTFYNDKSYYKSKINSIIEKNKKDFISKEKSFILKRNKSFNNTNPKYNIKFQFKSNKTKNFFKGRHIVDDKFEETFNTFNKTFTHKKEINSYSYFKKNKRVNLNKNNKNKLEKKPRVDTLEYLTKIMNSKKPRNLAEKQNENGNLNDNNNNKNEEYINIFRKKNNEKDKSSSEKSDIKKYIQVKKKLYKLNNIKKKKKEKEEELKKYLELYKLQKNIFNSNNNTFYNNTKIHNISNSPKNDEKNENDYLYNNYNNNEFLSSIDSTIVDKNNFYQRIMDIQNIYSNTIINNKIIINNYPYLNLNKENHLYNNKTGNDISQQKDKKINSRNNLDNTHIYHKENISEIYKKNLYSELKEEKIAEINYTYSSPRREEQKEIIKETDSEKKINEDNLNNDLKDFQINELNEYSFKLNNSNEDSNELKEINENNTLTTSKFGNSQLLSEQNRQSNKLLINDKEKETEKKTEKDKFNFTKEQLDNYKEILSSLFEYIKLITQRNALNDIISYGDMKYKYKIGFEIILTLIKLAPFNIIRAIQQTQYYHFVFRQLFIPYITRSFHKLKTFCSYHKLFEKGEKEIKFIYKKIAIKKINQFKMKENNNNIDKNNDLIKDENLEEIKEILNLDKKGFDAISNKDLSESKESDYIEWDDSFFSDKQDTNK